MLYYWYVKVKLKEKYRDGSHVERVIRVRSADHTGALRQAVRHVRKAGEQAISMWLDWQNPIPVNRRKR